MNNTDTRVFTLETFTQADPAAGTNLIWPVPARRRVEILAVSYTFTTSAAAANRNNGLIFDDAVDVFNRCSLSDNFTATQVRPVTFFVGAEEEKIEAARGRSFAALPSGLFMLQGEFIRTQIHNLDALDQVADWVVRAKTWIEAGT